MSTKEKLEIALGHLDTIQSFHSRIDGRASFLLTINLAMATVLIVNFKLDYLHKCISMPAIICAIAIAVSSIYLLLISYSHITSTTNSSLFFFGDIANEEHEKYINSFRTADTNKLLEDALSQIWNNSKIVKNKFSNINKAYLSTCVAICFWLLFLALITSSGSMPIVTPK